jgi:signal transduction histidine kinase
MPAARSRVAIWLSALGIAAFEVVGTFGATSNQPDRRDVTALSLVLVLAGPAAMAVRDRHPRSAAAVAIVSSVVYLGLGYAYGPIFVSVVVGLVWVRLRGHRRDVWVLAGVGFLGFVVADLVDPRSHGTVWFVGGQVARWLLVVLVGAELASTRAEQRAARLQADREERRRRAGEQRLALAQELHDVLAHNISLMNVQASVALHLLDEQPERARPALATIKQASHEALDELRAALALLRQEEGQPGAPHAPAPRLADLPGMVAGVRASGLRVDLEQEPVPDDVPGAVQLAAFRIVQEALTNVTRHARARSATVRVGYDGGVCIEVVDDGVGGVPVPGNGLTGMRERAGALGGTLEAGPGPDGGFRVSARLPGAGVP